MDDKIPSLLKQQMERIAAYNKSPVDKLNWFERVKYFEDICEVNAIDGRLMDAYKSLTFLREYHSKRQQLRLYGASVAFFSISLPSLFLRSHRKFELILSACLATAAISYTGAFYYQFSSIDQKYNITQLIADPAFREKLAARVECIDKKTDKSS